MFIFSPLRFQFGKEIFKKDVVEYCEAVRKNGLDNVLSFNSKKKLSVYNFICLLCDCISETKWDDYINLSDIYGKEEEYRIYHCTKKDKKCTLFITNELFVEFVEEGEKVIITEMGNLIKSDEVVDDYILKKGDYENIDIIYDNE